MVFSACLAGLAGSSSRSFAEKVHRTPGAQIGSPEQPGRDGAGSRDRACRAHRIQAFQQSLQGSRHGYGVQQHAVVTRVSLGGARRIRDVSRRHSACAAAQRATAPCHPERGPRRRPARSTRCAVALARLVWPDLIGAGRIGSDRVGAALARHLLGARPARCRRALAAAHKKTPVTGGTCHPALQRQGRSVPELGAISRSSRGAGPAAG